MDRYRRTAGLLALVAFAAFPLRAEQGGPVHTRLEARKVIRAQDGRESFEPAQAARPGDVIEYVATYRNAGASPVRDLQATLPIPPHTELLPGTARPASAKASLDAASFGAPPLERAVMRDGRTVREAIPYREYRYLRWHHAELAPDKSVSFAARVRVLDEPKF